MSDQSNVRKASDLDADQGPDSSSADISSAQVAKKAKRQPNIFLYLLEQVLFFKSRDGVDSNEFDDVLSEDLSELDEMIAQNIIAVDNFWDSIGYLLLASAASAGQLNVVKVILKYVNESVIMAYQESNSPLVLAFIKQHEEVVQLLLEHGFDPDIPGETHDYGTISCLSYACMEGKFAMVELLLKHGANPNLYHSPVIDLPLVRACQHKSTDVVKLLLKYGADPSMAEEDGRTALDYVEGGSEIAQILINAQLEPILK